MTALPSPSDDNQFSRLSRVPTDPKNPSYDLEPLQKSPAKYAAELVSLVRDLHALRSVVLTAASYEILAELHLARQSDGTDAFLKYSNTNQGKICLTDHGDKLVTLMKQVPPDSAEALMRMMIAVHHRDVDAKVDLDSAKLLLDHATDVVALGQPQRDLRKLYLSVSQGEIKVFPLPLAERLKQIKVDHAIDTYLGSNGTAMQESAVKYLHDSSGGNYCPPPFPSWHPRLQEAVDQSRLVVNRARQHSYTSFIPLAQDMRRLPDKSPPLMLRFGEQCFDEVEGIYATSPDKPPGKGIVLSGARLPQLFFDVDETKNDYSGLKKYAAENDQWLGKAIPHFADTCFVLLRGGIAVINNSDTFRIDGEHYCYWIPNDHQDGSYASVHLFPTSVLTAKIGRSQFDLHDAPARGTVDVTTQNVTSHGLRAASLEAKKDPLNMSWISTLFGSCSFAHPVQSPKYFDWEVALAGSLWRDINNHIHGSYRIWNYRTEKNRVDQDLKPLQDQHFVVHDVAVAYQQLWDLFRVRYAAWKNDQTPGPKDSPRMLAEVYHWHQIGPRLPHNDPPILCIGSKNDRSLPVVPIIDCADLALLFDCPEKYLPLNGTGGENEEVSIWNRYVRPKLFDAENPHREGDAELILMAREYVPHGE